MMLKIKYFAIPLKSPSKFCGKNILTFLPEFVFMEINKKIGFNNYRKNRFLYIYTIFILITLFYLLPTPMQTHCIDAISGRCGFVFCSQSIP